MNIEALPLEVPEHLELDISGLGVGDSARLSEVKAPDGVTILDDLEETVIASVALPRAEEPEEPVEGAEGEEGAEGAETPEGEAAEADAATGDGEAAETVEG